MPPRYAHLIRWLCWTLATIAGLCVGGAVLVLANELGLDSVLFELSTRSYTLGGVISIIGPMFYSAVIGTITGLAQWALLRRWFQTARWWVLVTAGCLMAGSYTFFFVGNIVQRAFVPFPSGFLTGPYVPPPFVSVIAASGPGAILGVGQWLVLRRQMRRFGWWIVANIIAWPIGIILTFWVNDLLQAWTWSPCGGLYAWSSIPNWFLSSYLSIWDLPNLLALGVVVGTLTGLVLIYAQRMSSVAESKERLFN